jgi:hypothetical protein
MLCFSTESLFFCGGVGNGTLILYRLNHNNHIYFLQLLSVCFLPGDVYLRLTQRFTICCISSHHSLVCEAAGNLVVMFHITSLRFIRSMECPFQVKWLLISDPKNLVIVVGECAVAMFTINGMVIGVQDRLPVITAACLRPGSPTI